MKLLRKVTRAKGTTSRRQLLRALGISAAAAPFVPALDGWAAPGATAPKRLFLLFSPHGVIPETYWPSGNETSFTFPAGGILEPLAPYKDQMIVFKGLKRDTRGPGDHERCFCNMWTGTALAPGSQEANGPSIDQIIAKAIKPTTAFESLQFSVQPHYTSDTDSTSRAGRSDGNMIYAAAKQRIPSEFNPYKMFDRLFAGVGAGGAGMQVTGGATMPGGDPAAGERLRARKQSVLDFVAEEVMDLRRNVVGKQDGLRIDSHLDSVREIEKRLQAPARTCGGITRPDGTLDIDKGENFPRLIGVMNQLAVASFACDRTRIASIQYSRGFSRHTHTWLGMKDWHHTISHDKGATKALTSMQRWYMERFNELINALKAVDEGGKPMLDNMLVVYVGELYTPWNHLANPSVAFTFGKLGGAMRTGRYLDFGMAKDHNQFLVTMIQALGVTGVNKVGDMGGEGPLPGVLG
jgi:Protein of unknown function (DUF1552)